MVHGKVSEDLAVEFDARFGQLPHEGAVRHAVQTGTRVDALDPQAAELALAEFPSDVCVLETFLDGVFRNRPNILAGTVVPFGHFQDLLAACA